MSPAPLVTCTFSSDAVHSTYQGGDLPQKQKQKEIMGGCAHLHLRAFAGVGQVKSLVIRW